MDQGQNNFSRRLRSGISAVRIAATVLSPRITAIDISAIRGLDTASRGIMTILAGLLWSLSPHHSALKIWQEGGEGIQSAWLSVSTRTYHSARVAYKFE